jgi:hypothetical protein
MSSAVDPTGYSAPAVDEEEITGEAVPDDPDLIGGEVKVGGGPAPAWMRYFNWAIWVWAIAYLVTNLVGGFGLPILLFFAAAMASWLIYIIVRKKPPEP